METRPMAILTVTGAVTTDSGLRHPEEPASAGVPKGASMVDAAFPRHGAEALATLIRLVGDFDLAEEGLQEAFAAAATAWGDAPPDNPRAWLVAVGRRRALDQLRRLIAFRSRQDLHAHHGGGAEDAPRTG